MLQPPLIFSERGRSPHERRVHRPHLPLTFQVHCTAYTQSLYALQSLVCTCIQSAPLSHQKPVVLPHSSMCFFKIDPKHAPLKPPGAAPTLTSLEEHYKAALAGEESGPGTALDEANPTSNSIAMSLDINDKLEPNRPVTNSSAGTAKKRKKSVPLASKVTINPR